MYTRLSMYIVHNAFNCPIADDQPSDYQRTRDCLQRIQLLIAKRLPTYTRLPSTRQIAFITSDGRRSVSLSDEARRVRVVSDLVNGSEDHVRQMVNQHPRTDLNLVKHLRQGPRSRVGGRPTAQAETGHSTELQLQPCRRLGGRPTAQAETGDSTELQLQPCRWASHNTG